MKRVVLPLSFFFILFTLSSAFHPESLPLSQVINHQHHDNHQIKPTTSDGSDSPNILLPTDSSTVPEHTESSPVEFKEAVSEPEIVPVQMRNRFSFPVYRLNPIRCPKLNRFMRRRVNDLGFDPVLTYVIRNRDLASDFLEVERAIRLFDQNYMMEPRRHHHHDHDDHDEEEEDDQFQLVEMKEEDHDHDHDEEDEDEDEREDKHKDGLKKKSNNEKDEDDKEKHKKKRKEKDGLKKKHKKRDHDDHDEDEDDNNMEKYVLKKIRKFMNFF